MKRIDCPDAEWETAAPADWKPEGEVLSRLESVIRKDYGNIAGIVIVRDGIPAYESYFDGYGREDAVHVASVTKSVLSALVGIAVEKGFIGSVEQPVLDFFPEYEPGPGEAGKRAVTLRHLLAMTASYAFEREPFQELCSSPDWAKFALGLLDGGKQGGKFQYSTAGAHLLSAVLTRSTGRTAREFANEHLFGPLGMNRVPEYRLTADRYMDFLTGRQAAGWVSSPEGNSAGGWGLTLRPRDMARFGQLYLNRGEWNGKQVLPSRWVTDSVRGNPNGYGYLWWLVDTPEIRAFCAFGDGGNAIFCLPEKRLVAAVASRFDMAPKDRVELLVRHILPAFPD